MTIRFLGRLRSDQFRKKYGIAFLLCLVVVLFYDSNLFGQSISLNMGGGEGGSLTARLVQMFLVVALLSLAPALLVMVTSFTRIVIVLAFLRNAIGLQHSPPNMVIIGMALFLTGFVMYPTFEKTYEEGVRPYIEEKITEEVAWNKSVGPLQVFMAKHTREPDLGLFIDMSNTLENKENAYESPESIPLRILVPAFMISELRRAFEIGFVLFLPFLVIDLVVASILMSMGMMMLPPASVSLPFKLIFFVLVDGWYLIAGGLVHSYGGG